MAVSRRGAQVLSWTDAQGRELLYLSPTSTGANGKPVRGGIPVCFPQFAGRGHLPKHGFARTTDWTHVDDFGDEAAGVGMHLQLREQPQTLAIWPHRFLLDLWAVLFERRLRVTIQVHNTDPQPWTFTAALHTYYRVEATAGAALHGLRGLTYEDALQGGRQVREAQESPDFARAVDRVYLAAPERLVLSGPGRRLEITQQGFSDTVVWTPGPGGAAGLGDMPDGDENHMVCVEAAQVANPVELQPGEIWRGSQETHLR